MKGAPSVSIPANLRIDEPLPGAYVLWSEPLPLSSTNRERLTTPRNDPVPRVALNRTPQPVRPLVVAVADHVAAKYDPAWMETEIGQRVCAAAGRVAGRAG